MKNNRTFLEKLLDGAEIEWKPLIKVASLTRGRVISKEYLANNLGDYPVYSSQTVNNGEIGKINSFDFDGEFVSWTTDGANAGTVFYRSGKFSITNVCGLIKIQNNLELSYKFLFYWLSIEAKNHVYSGMGNPKLMSHQMEKILIPIPPLSVQTKIVRILDALTALTSELTSELILRQKQYEYYREKLLSEEELGKVGFEWRTIDEVFHLKNGYTPSKSIKKYWENGTIPWFRMEDIRENGRILNTSLQKVSESAVKGGRLFPANSIIVATSATIGEHALITIPFLANQRFTVLSLKPEYIDKFNIYFLYYYCFIFDDWCLKNTTVSSFSSVDMNGFRKFRIPLIQLEEQQRIVSILDKFETLTNSITEGLPLAIEQSQKRYEYYRELLLSFS
ncbi:restriction endonuclease subunit S [Haemophilus influenzae]